MEKRFGDSVPVLPWTFVVACQKASSLLKLGDLPQPGDDIFVEDVTKQSYSVYLYPKKVDTGTLLRHAYRLVVSYILMSIFMHLDLRRLYPGSRRSLSERNRRRKDHRL